MPVVRLVLLSIFSMETNPRAGYNTSADFWLTLPPKAAADRECLCLPKECSKTTYERTFVREKILRLKRDCLKEPALRLAIVMVSFKLTE